MSERAAPQRPGRARALRPRAPGASEPRAPARAMLRCLMRPRSGHGRELGALRPGTPSTRLRLKLGRKLEASAPRLPRPERCHAVSDPECERLAPLQTLSASVSASGRPAVPLRGAPSHVELSMDSQAEGQAGGRADGRVEGREPKALRRRRIGGERHLAHPSPSSAPSVPPSLLIPTISGDIFNTTWLKQCSLSVATLLT